MIDLHTHVLPGIDDGARTLDDAAEMVAAAAAAGTEVMVATPHIDHHYELAPGSIAARVDQLNAALEDRGRDVRIRVGGEVAALRAFELTDEELQAVRLGGGPWLLLEAPLTPAAGAIDIESLVFDLQLRGFRIVLAHPERAPLFQHDVTRLERLVHGGALASITAGSMSGSFGDTVRRFTVELLSRGLVHNVASDSHDARRRPPRLLEGFERMERDLPGITEQADYLTRALPEAILAGEPLPPHPEPPRRIRRWRPFARR